MVARNDKLVSKMLDDAMDHHIEVAFGKNAKQEKFTLGMVNPNKRKSIEGWGHGGMINLKTDRVIQGDLYSINANNHIIIDQKENVFLERRVQGDRRTLRLKVKKIEIKSRKVIVTGGELVW